SPGRRPAALTGCPIRGMCVHGGCGHHLLSRVPATGSRPVSPDPGSLAVSQLEGGVHPRWLAPPSRPEQARPLYEEGAFNDDDGALPAADLIWMPPRLGLRWPAAGSCSSWAGGRAQSPDHPRVETLTRGHGAAG